MTKKTKTPPKGRAPKREAAVERTQAQLSPPKKQEVAVAAAKGRPMLTWVGKRPLRRVTAFPAQLVETFNPLGRKDGWQNLLFHSDNKEVLAWLLANGFRGKVNLIYIDPPFDSGADYVRKVQLRGVAGTTKIDGETYTLGEQIQYTDIWVNDNYLQFMYERLLLLKELLAEDGCIYLHCDWHKSHHLRCLMDEVFGSEKCLNEIIWKRTSARSDSHTFNHIHDSVLFYAKGESFRFNQLFLPHDPDYIAKYYTYTEPNGRRFATIDATQAGLRNGPSGEPWRGFDPASKGNHWKFGPVDLDRLDAEGRIYWPEKAGGWPRLKSYLDEAKGSAIQSIWTDIKAVNSQAEERGDYPTQKPEALLDRVIQASSDPGDLILDCFIGCGTTAAVAQKLGQRWIGCDVNKGAIQTTARRLQGIIQEQIEAERQGVLLEKETRVSPKPVALAFSVYRVNDYDLEIQHNEAVNLACEHLGVQRTRTDPYFDGALGKRLVKIVPFGHPLTLLDLQEIERELKSRPKEDRHVVLVCLGKEPAVDTWLEDWNRHRPVNKIEVIELRTDKKYGKFFTHEPARARVEIKRVKGKIVVQIKDFISPTIIERLNMDQTLFKAQITDWRAMVDSVMIDTAYGGQVFNVALSDVPERKADLVAGRYELPAPEGPTAVAVKITDMLGEEVLVTAKV
jgi:adenine-specific DNA-methyltransferase